MKSIFYKKENYENTISNIIYNHLLFYPTPANLSYFWSFGSLAALCLGIQMLSGIFLAMHYVPSIIYAFKSVEHIMRDVNYGWLISYMHANGASAFFAVVYCHMFSGLFYKSYVISNSIVWISGMIMFMLMMATAFIGYVLPWGQMSFWGATVITNLFSVIPLIGIDLVYWLWGGFSVGGATLNKFYSLHYFLPFIIVGAVMMHIFYLHTQGSSSPITSPRDTSTFILPLYPYFFVKDLVGILFFAMFFSYFIFFNPNILGHSDNYMEANSLVTPEHIVPEWYFLPFYAILRSIPNKELGMVAMGCSLIIFILLPYLNFFGEKLTQFIRVVYTQKFMSKATTSVFSKFSYYQDKLEENSKFFVIIFAVIVIVLGFMGARPVEYPYVEVGSFLTFSYFFFIFIISLFFIEQDEVNMLDKGFWFTACGIFKKSISTYWNYVPYPWNI